MFKKMFLKRKSFLALIASALLLAVCVTSSFAFLKKESNAVVNTFVGGKIETISEIEVEEEFTPSTGLKKNVTVTNKGNKDAYVRIQLISYRVAADGTTHIGGTATIPSFTPGTGWLSMGNGWYVYTTPVASGEKPAQPLIGSAGITLTTYTDADGGKQVVEVVAEAVSAAEADRDAVAEAWGVSIGETGAISKKN